MLCVRLNVRYKFSFLTLMPASHQTFQALLVSQTNFHGGIKILTVLWKLILMVRCRVSIKKSFSFLEWLINSDFSNINVHFSDLAFSLTKNRHIIFRRGNFPDHSKSFQSLVECGRYKINFLFCLYNLQFSDWGCWPHVSLTVWKLPFHNWKQIKTNLPAGLQDTAAKIWQRCSHFLSKQAAGRYLSVLYTLWDIWVIINRLGAQISRAWGTPRSSVKPPLQIKWSVSQRESLWGRLSEDVPQPTRLFDSPPSAAAVGGPAIPLRATVHDGNQLLSLLHVLTVFKLQQVLVISLLRTEVGLIHVFLMLFALLCSSFVRFFCPTQKWNPAAEQRADSRYQIGSGSTVIGTDRSRQRKSVSTKRLC